MKPALAAFTALAGVGGLAVTGLGLIRVPVRAVPARDWFRSRWRTFGGETPAARRARWRIGLSVLAGVLVWLASGWVLAVVLAPVVIWGLPILLQTTSSKNEIARLEAMSEWAQNLASVLGVGVGIEQAITASLRSAPAPIRGEVARLVARLDARWDTVTALRAFADDLADGTGDFLAAALVLGASRRGSQLSSVLDGLASAVRDDVKVRRAVDAEQAKGRTTARLVTVISAGGLGLMLLTPYAEAYRTPSGQMLLAVLLSCYGGCLIWMRRITATPRQRRILCDDGGR